jgi:hypothetical protein
MHNEGTRAVDAARSDTPATQFEALRKSNEYHARVAQLIKNRREHRALIERTMQVQREQKFRHVG